MSLSLTDDKTTVTNLLSLDINDAQNQAWIELQLLTTKGMTPATEDVAAFPFYRPFYVVGLLLWLDLGNDIKKAEGIESNQSFEVTRRWMLYQRGIDLTEELEISSIYTVDSFLANLSGDSPAVPATVTVGVGFMRF